MRGPAYTLPPSTLPASQSPEPDSESYDALDEVLSLFRANTFFRNFEIQGNADRLLVYGILWVSECLAKIRPNMSARLVVFSTCIPFLPFPIDFTPKVTKLEYTVGELSAIVLSYLRLNLSLTT